jgi:hypothetical protein
MGRLITVLCPSGVRSKGLEMGGEWWDIPNVHTLTVDAKLRVRIPDAKPGQVFAYENRGDGSFTLTEVKVTRKERFPPGSLLKYFTPEKNAEEAALLAGCSLQVEKGRE